VKHVLIVISVLFILLFSALMANGQAGAVCPGAVTQALAQLGTNCAAMSRNSACYGFNNVVTKFNVTVPPDFFTTTDERAQLETIDSLRTGPLDLANEQFGVSLLNVQANLPDALPGQGVVFVLLGGAQVEEATPKGKIVVPKTAVQVNVTAASDFRTQPNTGAWKASSQIDSVPAGVALSADAIDPTGTWIRVIYNLKPGWIMRSSVAEDVSSLTVIGPDNYTPMQAFFFRTGIGGVTCDQVPSLLAVQGPRNTNIDLNADGVDIRIGSTVIFQTLPEGANPPTTLQISVVAGTATLYPGTSQEIIVPAGFTISISLAPDGHSVVGSWTPIRPLSSEELAKFSILQLVTGNVLNYDVALPVLTTASGAGGAGTILVFPNPADEEEARQACASGQLSPSVCAVFGF